MVKSRLLSFFLAVFFSFVCLSVSSQFVTVGSANGNGGFYELTPEDCHLSGAVWSQVKINLAEPFELGFYLNFGANNGVGSFNEGGDGIAFVLHNDARQTAAIGCPGPGLGAGNAKHCTGGISPSWGFKWDTYPDTFDPALPTGNDYLMCFLNGNMEAVAPGDFGAGQYQNLGELEDGIDRNLRISWNPHTMTLMLFMGGRLTRTEQVNLISVLGGTTAWWGWTAAAGAEFNRQTVMLHTSPLPVEMGDFIAVSTGSRVLLQWNTLSETNNDFFTVQHSADGEDFENIGHVAAQNMPSGYTFSDDYPYLGKNYYRIRQTDRDGAVSFSRSIALFVTPSTPEPDLAIYPNPATRFVGFNLRDAAEGGELEVTDMSGRTVFRRLFGPGTYLLEEPVAGWTPGYYTAKIRSLSGQSGKAKPFVIGRE